MISETTKIHITIKASLHLCVDRMDRDAPPEMKIVHFSSNHINPHDVQQKNCSRVLDDAFVGNETINVSSQLSYWPFPSVWQKEAKLSIRRYADASTMNFTYIPINLTMATYPHICRIAHA